LARLFQDLQLPPDLEDALNRVDNRFSASTYSVVHFVADMPVRLPPEMLAKGPPAARALGAIAFVQTEFQIIDRHTEQHNELGEASHAAYKDRQKQSVMMRLKVGSDTRRPPAPDDGGNHGDNHAGGASGDKHE
jgi:uncharacterized protein (TIGR04562 family)